MQSAADHELCMDEVYTDYGVLQKRTKATTKTAFY